MVSQSKEEEKIANQCPFYDVPSKNLLIAQILLHNLGARMLRGLKSSTTPAEHDSIILSMKIIEREIEWREEGLHGCPESDPPDVTEDER